MLPEQNFSIPAENAVRDLKIIRFTRFLFFEVENSARSKLLSQVCSLYSHGSTVATERLLSFVCRGAIKLVGVGGSELSERDSFNTASTIAVEPTRWKVRQGDNQVR